MRRLILIAALLVGLGTLPAWADFDAGVAAYDSGDYETAFREFKTLAEQGNAHAQFNLGYMYHKGEGVPQDDAEAVKWFRMSADQGYAKAQNALASMYREGRGVPQDYREAVKWRRLAADQGYAEALRALGRFANERRISGIISDRRRNR